MDSSAQAGSSACSSPPASGTESVSRDCKWLGFGSTPVWSLCGYGCMQRTGNKNGGNIRFLQNISNFTSFTNLKVRLLVFRVACHYDLEQFLLTCRHDEGIFSCAKTSSEGKLWSGNLHSTQGRDLIVTPREQEVAHFPFASPHPAPAGCK